MSFTYFITFLYIFLYFYTANADHQSSNEQLAKIDNAVNDSGKQISETTVQNDLNKESIQQKLGTTMSEAYIKTDSMSTNGQFRNSEERLKKLYNAVSYKFGQVSSLSVHLYLRKESALKEHGITELEASEIIRVLLGGHMTINNFIKILKKELTNEQLDYIYNWVRQNKKSKSKIGFQGLRHHEVTKDKIKEYLYAEHAQYGLTPKDVEKITELLKFNHMEKNEFKALMTSGQALNY
ncbi:uncharacterized protein LOC126835118 [Adelges cooleyi]|uniref:uncharacterized protein LOC126835118 n=1 Tax=Adelges cooleyi TaxID=133065 RepID=UPI0021807418|nr:uncharacterized protein LOC126835118 [Adelges cooleyi]